MIQMMPNKWFMMLFFFNFSFSVLMLLISFNFYNKFNIKSIYIMLNW